MAKIKNNGEGNHPHADIKSTNFSQDQSINSLQEPKQPETPKNHSEIKKSTFVWIDYLKGKNSQPIIANIVSIFALLVSTILAVVTYQLYNIASGQVDSVKKAGDAAQSSAITAKNTLNETKDYNKKYLKLQKDAFNLTSDDAAKKEKSDSENAKRQERSVNAQIKSLKETQKEFEIENKPLIQVLDIKFDTLIAGKSMYIKYAYINYGKQPAKCYTNTVGTVFTTDKKMNDFSKPVYDYTNLNLYLSGFATFQNQWRSRDTVPKKFRDAVMNGDINVFLFGTLTFQNTVTYQKYLYKYNYRLNYKHAAFNVEGVTDTIIYVK